MKIDKINSINDLEKILYDGTKEEIEKVLEDYKVSYEYNKKYRSFNVTSMKLMEMSRGYKSHYKPNCVEYFETKYQYNEKR